MRRERPSLCHFRWLMATVRVLRKLKAAEMLTYADDEVRAGMDKIAKRGLDR